MGAVTHSNLGDVFSYHAPKGDFQIEKYHRLRQGAKKAAEAVLNGDDNRAAALDEFGELIRRETGECRDQREALGSIQAAHAFLGGAGVAMITAIEGRTLLPAEVDAEITAATIQAIRAALMWANASVALEGRI